MAKKKLTKTIQVPDCQHCELLLECLPLGGSLKFENKNCIFIEEKN